MNLRRRPATPDPSGCTAARRRRLGSALALVLLAAVGACTAGSAGSTATTLPITTAAPTTTTSTVAPTTVFQPTAPQKTREDAAAHLVAAWRAGDRAAALADASPDAVAAVFAMAYPAGGVQARGCSSAVAGPSSCIYRLFVSNALLSLSAIQAAGGWYISAAQFES